MSHPRPVHARHGQFTRARFFLAPLVAAFLWAPAAHAQVVGTTAAADVTTAVTTRAEASRTSLAAAQAQSSPAPWYERLRFSGDFRSRYEGFYQEGRETRNRGRLRLRLRLDTPINDDTRFQLQVASGDAGTPVSTNQTFTGFFTPKAFNLDRAYIAYNPRAASAMTLGLGKFSFPQTRTQMVFDDDLNYEGVWEEVSWKPQAGVGVTLGAIQTVVNEVSSRADSYMLAGYGQVAFTLGAHSLEVSAANYGWGNPDQIAVGQAEGPLTAILTNAVVRERGNIVGFASGFNVVDVIAEATFQTGRPEYPVRILADVARNTKAASNRDTGFWAEAEYGQPSRQGTWGAVYTYGWIEQDVTPSAFAFSDIPGTNLRLHMLETSYVALPNVSLDVTLHLTKRLFLAEASAPNPWLSRLHVAAVVRF